ncbi:hypothetical protein FRC00_012955 [Tulasnella sp. 408]|nr:hypothetical protein FRC00_012955 [Tulasnella sp. 408]
MDASDSSFAQSQSTDAELPFASTSEAMVVDELDAEAEKKAAKSAKKAAREAKRQRKAEKKRRKAEKVASKEEGSKKAKKGKRKPQSDETQSEASCTVAESEKAGQKRKRDETEDEAGPSTDTKGKSVSPARKKKRVKLIMPIPRPTIKYSPSRGPCEKKGILRAPALNASSSKEQGGSDGEKGKRVTFTKTVISHTVARWWEEAGWSDDGI